MEMARIEEALHLRLDGKLSYAQIGRAMGVSKWDARRLCDVGRSYLQGYAAGFRAAKELRK